MNSTVCNVHRSKTYDKQLDMYFNLDENDIKRLNAIKKFLPLDTNLVGFNGDDIEIETYDEDIIYIYCDSKKNTNAYCEFHLYSDKDPYIDIEYTAKVLFCTEEMIKFIIEENKNCSNNLIRRMLEFHGYLRPAINYIADMPEISKAKLLGYDSFEVVDDEYVIYYNKE